MKDCRFLQLPHPWISYFKTFLDSLCAVTDETDAATGKEDLNPVVVRVGTCPVECHFDLHSSKVALWWCCCCWWSTSMLFEVVIICSYSGGGPGAVTAIVIGFGECWLKEKKGSHTSFIQSFKSLANCPLTNEKHSWKRLPRTHHASSEWFLALYLSYYSIVLVLLTYW